ncbi:MAG TPA: hypothetical protein VK009_05100 [Chloroflexota bacterium]|nr:hypothetical protein [Chloroflexota bacterium]
MADDRLGLLADLLRRRNAVDDEIASVIGRPALTGHIGEFIAASVFGIELESSAASASVDGQFTWGPLAGRSVNVKLYGRNEGLLDLTPTKYPDFYLVLAGPRGAAASSRGAVRPCVIESVYLFEAAMLDGALRDRGLKIGVATSVRRDLWQSAEVFPQQNPDFPLTSAQRAQLELFAPAT